MLTQYINELRKKVHSIDATPEDRLLFAYAQAYRKGEQALSAFRGRLVVKEINTKYDSNAQIAILFNEKSEPHEYATYQAFRALCKQKADEKMSSLKNKLETAINALTQEEKE